MQAVELEKDLQYNERNSLVLFAFPPKNPFIVLLFLGVTLFNNIISVFICVFRTRDSGDFSVSGTGRNEFVEEFTLPSLYCNLSVGILNCWDFEALPSAVGVFLVFGIF